MLDELLRHNSLGTKEEIQFVLFKALALKEQKTADLRAYCISHKYSISRSFNGILSLLHYLGFATVNSQTAQLNNSGFDRTKYIEKGLKYFDEPHFFEHLLNSIQKEQKIHEIFTPQNVMFDAEKKLFFIKSNLIPLNSFPLRNLLLSLEFLKEDILNSNHLTVVKPFMKLFEKIVIKGFDQKEKGKKRISIKQLKKGLKIKEQIGKEAEEYVLKHERKRLNNHPFKSKIKRISDDYANAGYDIESFTGVNTIVPNRFIEVKSYKDNVSFYWTRNEVEIAKKLGEEYFLYLVDRNKYESENYTPMIIKNPFYRIFESELWQIETENWKITLDE